MDIVQKNVTVARLAPTVLFCRLVHALLNENGGKLPLASLETRFLERFGSPVRPSVYGFSSLHALLLSVQHLIILRGKGSKRFISMHKSIAGEISRRKLVKGVTMQRGSLFRSNSPALPSTGILCRAETSRELADSRAEESC